MTTATIEFEIEKSVEEVWNVITDLQQYEWRSDILQIKILDDKTFIEVSKDDIETTFTITSFEVGKRYAFDIDNKNMKGHWIGLFEKTNKGTKVIFEEQVEVKHAIMKLLVKKFLTKQQTIYVDDLRNVWK